MALVFSGVAIATASSASAATTGLGTLTKTGKDLTNGSTAVAGGASGTANPGDTLQWVLNYSNTQSTSVNANITDPITGDQAYVPGSLQVPPGMTGQYSTNGGASYTTTQPASGVNAVGATGSVGPGTTGATSPFGAPTSSFKTSTTGGDGWQALTYNGNVYLNHHHFTPSAGGGAGRQLDCYNLISGAQCPGFSGGGGNIQSTSGSSPCTTNGCGDLVTGTYNWSYLDPATGKIWFAASISGTKTYGMACFDTTTNTSCGFYLNYTNGTSNAGGGIYTTNNVGLGIIGSKLYFLDSSGFLDCFDVTTKAACTPPSFQLFPWSQGTTSLAFLGYSGNVQTFGSSTYVWATTFNPADGSVYLGCYNTVTNSACFTPIKTTVSSGGSAAMAPVLNSSGSVTGACLQTAPGTANAWTCWNTSGQVMSQSYPQQASGWVGYLNNSSAGPGGVYVSGTKVFMAYNNQSTAVTTYTCWDWSLNGGSGGSCSGFTNPTSTTLNGGTPIGVSAYTISSVSSFPGCLVEDGDAGVLQFFNEKTGAPCTTSTGSVSVRPAAYYCDGGSNHVTGWKNFTISGLTSSQYTGATFTVSDANGNPLPGFTGVTLSNTQQVVDLSSIPYSGTTTSLTVSVKLLNADATAKPTVTLNYNGDPMQVCFKTTVPKTCVTTGTTAPDVANAVTTIPGGATDGPIGVSSGTATFTIASPASACSLAFTKTADKSMYGPGDTVTYTVAVKNTGTADWTSSNPATFTDDLTNVLANATYNSNATASSGTVSYTAPVLSWSGALAAGATATITYSVTVKSTATSTSAPLTNTIVSSNPNTNCATGSTDPKCTVTVPPASPGLSLVKSAALTTDANNDGKAGVGDRITFSFVVKNTGTITLHNITVADQLVAPAGPAVTVTCPAGDLAPGASVTCTSSVYTVTQADVDAGSVANTATAHGLTPGGTDVPSNPSGTTTPTPTGTGLSLVKSAALTTDANNDGKAGVGDRITFSFLVKNTGTITLHNITVADQLVAPAGPAVTVTCPSGNLAPGASVTCTSSAYTVTQSDVDAGSVANTATAHGLTPGGTDVPSNPSGTTTPTPTSTGLTLVKSAALTTDANNDGKAGVADRITFSFVVKNTGTITLHNVTVADQLVAPAGPSVTVTCPTGDLAPGASLTCTSSAYTVTQADVDAGSVANTATAHGLTPGGTDVPSNPSGTTTPTPTSTGLTLVKSAALTTDANNDGKAGVADEITFSFVVKNTGTVTLHNITVADQLVAPAGPAVTVTCPTGDLAPGASLTCTSSAYTVTQADVDAGSVANTATAHGLTPGGTDVPSNQSQTTTPTPTSTGLSLVKSAALTTDANNDAKAGVGDQITFSFVVKNTGTVTLHNITVADQLVAPAGPAVTVTCPTGDLAPGASLTCTSSAYTVTQADVDAGSVANTAIAHGLTPGGSDVPSNPSGTTTPTPTSTGLSLVKSAALTTDTNGDGKAGVADQITFSFVVTNNGSTTLHNITVADQLVAPAGPAVTVTCPSGNLTPGASVTCTSSPYAVTQADVDAGSVANTATAHGLTPGGTDVPSNPSGTTTPTPTSTGLSLVKSAALTTDTNGDGKAGVADQITFSFVVTNNGSTTLHNITVADQLVAPAGPAVTVTCPSGNLTPGASVTCTSSPYAVTQADVDAGSVANTATAHGLTPGGSDVPSNPSGTTTPTPSSTGLTLVKSAALTTDANNDGKAGVADEITFSFLVKNTGTVTLHNITLADQLVAPAGPAVTVTCPTGDLAPGASLTCTSSAYTVTQADVDAGSVANTATAHGLTPGGTDVPSNPSGTTTPTPTTTGLSLVKSAALTTDTNGDGKAGVADEITFSFLVKNTGTVTLHNVTVADQLVAPAGPAVTVTCPTGDLAPGASLTCTSSAYTVTQADVDAGSVANTATAHGLTPGGTDVPSNPSQTTTPTPSSTGLTLVKSAALTTDTNGDGKAGVGDEITFSFVVKNTGTITLHNISVADQLGAPAGPAVTVTCPAGDVAPSASVTCTSSAYVVTQADVDAGSVANTATAHGLTPGGTDVPSNPSGTTTPTPTNTGLSLVKSASISTDSNGDGKAGVADEITFSFLVKNTGTVTLHDVTVADQLVAPAGPAVTVTCPSGNLAPGASVTCTSSPYAVTQADVDAGSVANIAIAHGLTPGGTDVPSNQSQTTTPTPTGTGLSLVKSASISTDTNGDGKAGVGDEITFSFVVKNTGTVTLHDVTVADQLVAPAGPAVTVTCPTGDLAPGASVTCTSLPYAVTQADVDAGSVANTATAHGLTPGGTDVPSNPSGTTTPTPTSTGLSLVKSAALTTDANNDGKAGVGDEITFSFVVKNTGTVTLHDVTVADQLVAPAGPAVTVTCPAGDLAPGASVTCTSSPYAVTQADVDAGSVANTATAHGLTPGGGHVPSKPSDTETPTASTLGMKLVKSAHLTLDANHDGAAELGDEVTYRFAVTNTGSVTLHHVKVDDQLVAPAGPAVAVTCPTSTLAPGTSMTCASSPYTITQADVDAGSVANMATAHGRTPAGEDVPSNQSGVRTPTIGDRLAFGGVARGVLAFTGSNAITLAGLGLLALGLGLGLTFVGRRRRSQETR